MSYLLLNFGFTIAICLTAALTVGFKTKTFWLTVSLAQLPMLLATAVFNHLIVSSGIVDYNDDLLLGIRVGAAPIEDFAYALTATVLLPALWVLFGRLASKSKKVDAQ